MIRRADNVHISYSPLGFGRGWLTLHVGPRHFRVKRVDRATYIGTFRWAAQMPQRLATLGAYSCWLYQDSYFWDNGRLGPTQIRAAIDELLATV